MSYQTELTQNNTDLQSILDAVNALPDASSGGSGGYEIGSFTVSYLTIVDGVYYELPFIVGQTWSEWLDSACNLAVYQSGYGPMKRASSGDYVLLYDYSGSPYVSTDGTSSGRVLVSDLIQNGVLYSIYSVQPASL